MASRVTEIIVDCRDLDAVVAFWCAALSYEPTYAGEGWQAIGPPGGDPAVRAWIAAPQAPAIAFVVVSELKESKNRLHLDLTPFATSQADEVARLRALGATPVDVGQRDTPWVVMADVEGNEFCVMPEALDDDEGGA